MIVKLKADLFFFPEHCHCVDSSIISTACDPERKMDESVTLSKNLPEPWQSLSSCIIPQSRRDKGSGSQSCLQKAKVTVLYHQLVKLSGVSIESGKSHSNLKDNILYLLFSSWALHLTLT